MPWPLQLRGSRRTLKPKPILQRQYLESAPCENLHPLVYDSVLGIRCSLSNCISLAVMGVRIINNPLYGITAASWLDPLIYFSVAKHGD